MRKNPDFSIPIPADADSFTDIEFAPAASGTSMLASAGWDGKVRIWELQRVTGGMAAAPRAELAAGAPVLDMCWDESGRKVFSAGADNVVNMWDLGSGSQVKVPVGQHNAPVKACFWIPERRYLITGGWDGFVSVWDLRTPPAPAAQVQMGERVYAMDCRFPVMVCGMAETKNPSTQKGERKLSIFDLNNPTRPIRELASPVEQTRCIGISSKADVFTVGSIEGRCAVRYVDQSMDMAKGPDGKELAFAFKCHRPGKDIFPVNTIKYHPSTDARIQHILVTGGSDGAFVFWDKGLKQRVVEYGRDKIFNTTPIVASAFNGGGDLFAYATSYDWSKGHEFYKKGEGNAIYVHSLVQTDVIKPPGH